MCFGLCCGSGSDEASDPQGLPLTLQGSPPTPQGSPPTPQVLQSPPQARLPNPQAAQHNPNGGHPNANGGNPNVTRGNPNASGQEPEDTPQEPEKQVRGTHPVAITITGIIRTGFRLIQCAMGLAVVVLYAISMIKDGKGNDHIDGKMVYVLLCGSLGSVVGPILLAPSQTWLFFVVDIVMFLCYLVAFSMFGAVYLRKQSEGNPRIAREKIAVWILLGNVGIWFLAAIRSTCVYLLSTKARTPFHSKRSGNFVTNSYE